MLKPGDTSPDFDVVANDGSRVRLSDFAGKHVVLWFYPEADTPGCTIEGNGFRERHREIEAENAVVLGASYDASAKNQAFCDKFSFPFRLLSFDKTSGAPWDATDPDDPDWPRRITYLIGPDRRIVKAYATVVPAAHPTEVLADLRALAPR